MKNSGPARFLTTCLSTTVLIFGAMLIMCSIALAKPTRIAVTPQALKLRVGQKRELTATVYDENGKRLAMKVSWTPGKFATCVRVENYVLTAVKSGQCSVGAFIVRDDGTWIYSNKLEVTVK